MPRKPDVGIVFNGNHYYFEFVPLVRMQWPLIERQAYSVVVAADAVKLTIEFAVDVDAGHSMKHS